VLTEEVSMRSFLVLLTIFVSNVFAFRSNILTRQKVSSQFLKMSEEGVPPAAPSTSTSLIPIELETIETASSITGGIFGIIVGGPIFGLILAAIAKYVAKKENESGEALRGIGKTVIESYNFLLKLNGKYDITGKAASTLASATATISSDNEALESVKSTYVSTVSKVGELNTEYDLLNKGKQFVAVAGTLTDSTLEKIEELNTKVICLMVHLIIFRSYIFI